MTDWTHASRWPDVRHVKEGLCLWPSRSDWPVFHYDGRWRCSEPYLHAGDHLARISHEPDGEVAWEGPWVPEEAFDG